MLLKNANIYSNGDLRKGSILVQNEIIKSLYFEPYHNHYNLIKAKNKDAIEIDCEQRIILPGIIDIHSHLRDMEQAEKETFITGTKAAACSGITTVFNMPNINPPAITSNRIKEWIEKAKNDIFIDVGFIAGVPEDIDEKEIEKILELGVVGFKIYPLTPLSGINWIEPSNIQKLLLLSSKFQFPIFIHPDWPEPLKKKRELLDAYIKKGSSLLKIHNNLYPNKNEARFVKFIIDNYNTVIKKHELYPGKYPIIHFCHISCIESTKILYSFYNLDSRQISFEVTPHHMLLDDSIELKIPSYGKVLPPLREKSNSKYLFEELKKGNIRYIGTDHAPHTIEEKLQNFFQTPSGFPGFETYTLRFLDKIFKNQLKLKNFIQAAAENPAKRFNLKNRGLIKENYYADLIIIEKTEEYRIESQLFKSKAKYSPFENTNLSDCLTSVKIWKVFLRGSEINIEKAPAFGKIIRMQTIYEQR